MNDLWSVAVHWNPDFWIGLPLAASAILYMCGAMR
jgi:hypothetical protein